MYSAGSGTGSRDGGVCRRIPEPLWERRGFGGDLAVRTIACKAFVVLPVRLDGALDGLHRVYAEALMIASEGAREMEGYHGAPVCTSHR